MLIGLIFLQNAVANNGEINAKNRQGLGSRSTSRVWNLNWRYK